LGNSQIHSPAHSRLAFDLHARHALKRKHLDPFRDYTDGESFVDSLKFHL